MFADLSWISGVSTVNLPVSHHPLLQFPPLSSPPVLTACSYTGTGFCQMSSLAEIPGEELKAQLAVASGHHSCYHCHCTLSNFLDRLHFTTFPEISVNCCFYSLSTRSFSLVGFCSMLTSTAMGREGFFLKDTPSGAPLILHNGSQ